MTKGIDPSENEKPSGNRARATRYAKGKRSSADTVCFVCGLIGHYARDCKLRKGVETALLTSARNLDSDDETTTDEVAFVTTGETILFSRSHVLLDQASVNVFCNANLLTNLRPATDKIILNGVQSGISGVEVGTEGDFRDIGHVYYSQEASDNICHWL